MKFIADSMLGRLVRWLRLIGFDTLYYPHIADGLLLRRAREEERILLTRDTRLVKVRGLKRFLLLHENDPLDQLKEVITSFGLTSFINDRVDGSLPVSRCPLCNSQLDDISKERTKGRVPDYIYRTHSDIRHCPGCDKFYWKGTHQERMREKLLDVLQSL
jgi:uncharacterized protein with PIN domain